MPKNRLRVKQPGAKSVGIRTKNKIGNRKSGRGCNQISTGELREMLTKVSKRDRNMLRRIIETRNILPATPIEA